VWRVNAQFWIKPHTGHKSPEEGLTSAFRTLHFYNQQWKNYLKWLHLSKLL